MNTNLFITGMVAASVLASAVHAENGQNVPDELFTQALAQTSAESGQIAAVKLNNEGQYLVYIKSSRTCGSGGCRAQVWQKTDGGFQLIEKLPVGFLPIRDLSTSQNTSVLGVTAYDKAGPAQIIPVTEAQEGYEANWDSPLPAEAGKNLITQSMLISF